MKASEMTNEMLADKLEKVLIGNSIVIESAARLRNMGEIGEAVGREATREKSSQVGNAMKMREAVRGLLEIVCIDCKSSYEIDGKCVKCPRVVAAEAALSAPPRNCDVLSKDEVLEMLKDRSFSKEDAIEWLYDEAKG